MMLEEWIITMMLEEWDYYNDARRMDYHMMLEEWDYYNEARRMGLLY